MFVPCYDEESSIAKVVHDFRNALPKFLSVIFFLTMFDDFFTSGIIEISPMLIVCSFIMFSALSLLFADVVLQAVNQKERCEFEFRLQEIDRWYKNLKGGIQK